MVGYGSEYGRKRRTEAGYCVIRKSILVSLCLILHQPQVSKEYKLYFPLVVSSRANLGIEYWGIGQALDNTDHLDLSYIRYNHVDWSDLDGFESNLEGFRTVREPIVVITQWIHGSTACKYHVASSEYATFVLDLVVTYDLKDIEILNEPDASEGISPYFGCYGDKEAYVELFDLVYAMVKENHPDTTVRLGSFMMGDYDFIDYVLDTVSEYDSVGFHAYGYWDKSNGWSWGDQSASEKYSYLQARTTKPVILTETNLIYDGDCLENGFLETQKRFFSEVCQEIGNCILYAASTLSVSWRCAGLFYDDYTLLPVGDNFGRSP